MKLCIIGWYGTETLGDRAILGGILRIFSSINANTTFSIGSLYPFFTHRTLFEENEYFEKLSGGSDIYCFDVKNKEQFRLEIQKCDMLIMGGGPLMDLYEMEMIYAGFRYAKKKGKRTALFGCGVGPLYNNTYKKILAKISNNSDLIILRDNYSKELLAKILKQYSHQDNKIFVLGDPAFLAVDISKRSSSKDDFSVVNLRDYTYAFSTEKNQMIGDKIKNKLVELAEISNKVFLIPNHTFTLGGDDREFFARITNNMQNEKISIINKPLNLQETFDYVSKAKICMGMRYHAVLFQTILNGNNYILDYTDKGVGKISGFLNTIPQAQFYDNRYLNISDEKSNFDFNSNTYYSAITCDTMSSLLEGYRDILTTN